MAARKKERPPNMRVMVNAQHGRWEWVNPGGMSWDDLKTCGVFTKTDPQGGKYVPILL